MKRLTFSSDYLQQIVNGKDFTLVFYDENNLEEGDEVLFVQSPEIVPFAKVKLTRVTVKKFKELRESEMEGEEKIMTQHNGYKRYSSYEGKPVMSETPVKVVKFKINELI